MTGDEKRTVGELLQGRRQAKGLTIPEIAEKTRIRRTYLQALEENRFEAIPGEAYLTGFLRTYATILGLRPEEVKARYLEQVRSETPSDPPGESECQTEVRPRREGGPVPWAWPAVVILALVAVALVNLVLPPAPKTPSRTAEEDSPMAAAPVAPAASTAAEQAATPAVPPPATVVNEPPVVPAVAKDSAAGRQKPSAGEGVRTVAAAVAVEQDASPLTIRFAGNCEFRLESQGPNRVEIRSVSRPPQNYDLAAAAVLSWKFQRSARILIDNPAGVRAWVDDRPLKLNGRSEFHLLAADTDGG